MSLMCCPPFLRTSFRARRNAFRRCVVLALLIPGHWSPGQVLQLGSQRELFVDHYLIAKMEGVELRLHEPRREGVALKFDRPWEGGFSCYTTVIEDAGTYRMYYRGMPNARPDDSPEAVVCYAESPDGITWTKPNLGLFVIRGTRDNNVILTNSPFSHNFSPLLDTRPGVPEGERFKALAGDRHHLREAATLAVGANDRDGAVTYTDDYFAFEVCSARHPCRATGNCHCSRFVEEACHTDDTAPGLCGELVEGI